MNTPARYTIDLRVEQDLIRSRLVRGVRRYAAHQADRPLTAIELQYSANDGFVNFNLDTRPEHEPGDLTDMTHYGFESVECKHWRELSEWPDDEPLEMITHTGELIRFESGPVEIPEFERPFGEMLLDLLRSMRDAGDFAALPKAAGCQMGVEEMEGTFGWPDYADRGKDNLVE